uniref:Uncharacterized protein n=1 Tax=Anguilla anguilla TaxID=7936 RepID=A0A0E9TYU7_ANGAN
MAQIKHTHTHVRIICLLQNGIVSGDCISLV